MPVIAPPRIRTGLWVLIALCTALPLCSQNTEAAITGYMVSATSGRPLSGTVRAIRVSTGAVSLAWADASGYYLMPSVPPGTYVIRAEAQDYQSREIQQFEVHVAARLQIDFAFRPLADALLPGNYNNTTLPDNSGILPVLGPDLERGRSEPIEITAVQSEIRQPVSFLCDRAA